MVPREPPVLRAPRATLALWALLDPPAAVARLALLESTARMARMAPPAPVDPRETTEWTVPPVLADLREPLALVVPRVTRVRSVSRAPLVLVVLRESRARRATPELAAPSELLALRA